MPLVCNCEKDDNGTRKCPVHSFDEDAYLEKLWQCYLDGIEDGLPEKELFSALIKDTIKQVKLVVKLQAT